MRNEPPELKQLGRHLAKLIDRVDLTSAQVADHLGVARGCICAWRKGESVIPYWAHDPLASILRLDNREHAYLLSSMQFALLARWKNEKRVVKGLDNDSKS